MIYFKSLFIIQLYTFFFLIASSTQAFSQTQAYPFALQGTIYGCSTQERLNISYWRNGNRIFKDIVVVNNRFSLEGLIEEPSLFILTLPKRQSASVSFYIDTGQIHLDARLDTLNKKDHRSNSFELIKVTGSAIEDLYTDLKKSYQDLDKLKVSDSLKSSLVFSKLFFFSLRYPNSNLTSELLIGSGILSVDQVTLVHNNLSKAQQNGRYKTGFEALLKQLKATEIGSKFFYIEMPDSAGRKLAISQLAHNYLFVSFWASNCAPCREEHPALMELYAKYKSKGFEILGISLDISKDAWVKAIQKDNIAWPNVCDLKGIYNKMVEHYAVFAIPFNLLIDMKGNIIARNLNPESLEAILIQKL